jgi:hypothetical protein
MGLRPWCKSSDTCETKRVDVVVCKLAGNA